MRHALEEVRRGPNEASRKMMRYWHAQREREVQRDSGGDRRDTLRCGKKERGGSATYLSGYSADYDDVTFRLIVFKLVHKANSIKLIKYCYD